jgi:hypothetical protein
MTIQANAAFAVLRLLHKHFSYISRESANRELTSGDSNSILIYIHIGCSSTDPGPFAAAYLIY